MDIIISLFKTIKDILDFFVLIITIKMYFITKKEQKVKKSKIKKKTRHKKIAPSKRRYY